jgi:hypothetical protein
MMIASDSWNQRLEQFIACQHLAARSENSGRQPNQSECRDGRTGTLHAKARGQQRRAREVGP